MNKILMTGLAVGTDAGVCNVCNYDFEWLFKYPSIFLWADKILITKTIQNEIFSGSSLDDEGPALSKSIKMIFELAESEDLIEVVDPSKVVTSEVQNSIWHEVHKDRELLSKFYPQDVDLGDENNKIPLEITLNDIHYCGPHIATIYATLAITRALDANCFFNPRVLNYLTYKYGIRGMPHYSEPGKAEAFKSVFNAYLPNISFFPEYVFYSSYKAEGCEVCNRVQTCKDGFLIELEKNFNKFIAWRRYDEVLQLREVIDKIVNKRSKANGIIDPEEVLSEFKSIERKHLGRMKKVFPKITRWANIATMLSIPTAVFGLAVEKPLVTVTGAVLSGASTMTKEIVNYLSSKASWVGFTAKEEEIRILDVN